MRHVLQKCIDIGRIGDVAPALSRKKEFFARFFVSVDNIDTCAAFCRKCARNKSCRARSDNSDFHNPPSLSRISNHGFTFKPAKNCRLISSFRKCRNLLKPFVIRYIVL